MYKNIFFFTLISISCCLVAHSQDSLNSLEGTWRIDETDSFESWERVSKDSLSGKGFKLINGVTIITEYLGLKVLKSRYTYSARVPNQNEGKQIFFSGTLTDEKCFVFENKIHDFPKRIEYCIVENKLEVSVSDGGDKGFQLTLHKQ